MAYINGNKQVLSINQGGAGEGYERTANRLNEMPNEPDNTKYLSAKAIKDYIVNVAEVKNNRRIFIDGSADNEHYPTTKAVSDFVAGELENKQDAYTPSGSIGMLLMSDGNGGIEETSIEDGNVATQTFVYDEIDNLSDDVDTRIAGVFDSGSITPTIYDLNGTDISASIDNRELYYVKVGRMVYIRAAIYGVSSNITVAKIRVPDDIKPTYAGFGVNGLPCVSAGLYQPAGFTPTSTDNVIIEPSLTNNICLQNGLTLTNMGTSIIIEGTYLAAQ